jgi:diguanylate cyclase (GGDEF)-like protein
MDPTTAVVLMMLNLAVTGALVALVARRSLEQRPLLQCAASTGLFALAYALRLALGIDTAQPVAVVADVLMVFAAALFLRGQRQYMGRPPWLLSRVLLLCALFGLGHAALTALAGQAARHISLNCALGTLYLSMAFSAWQGQRTLTPAERPAQRLMLVTAGLLGAATLLRAADAAWRGVDTLFSGPTAQAYYALSSTCILLMGPSVLWWMFTRLNEQLRQLATHDPLTGALNRNGLSQALRRHFTAREALPLAWLMLDLDHFKRVNDTLGHRSGDRLLQLVAKALLEHVRAGDFVARLGGEEFLVGVIDPPAGRAEPLAERLRAAVAALHLSGAGGERWPCSVSIGVSQAFTQQADWETALRHADAALYAAKAGGRDRVVVAAWPGEAQPSSCF